MYSHEDLVNNQRFLYTYDSTGRLVRQSVLNGSTTTDYYFVCNWRGDVIRIYDGAVEDELLNLMGR